jgi:hypothetical protein
MKIPAAQVAESDRYFAFDFREFTGTVNASISALAFQFSPRDSVLIVQ